MTWSLHHGDCIAWLRTLPDASVDHVITDPPYAEHVHAKSRGAAKTTARGRQCVREREFGFAHLDGKTRRAAGHEIARVARRWSLVFCDLESVHLWRRTFVAAGIEPVRVGIWVKEACTPQFTGDRPAVAAEACVIAHPAGRKRWNGGGSRAIWHHAIVGRGFHNAGHDGKAERVHTAQKPLGLMLDLIDAFTDPGETICDPFSGSATTGIAALRLGRRFVGAELDATFHASAVARLEAEVNGSDIRAHRAGQIPMFSKTGTTDE